MKKHTKVISSILACSALLMGTLVAPAAFNAFPFKGVVAEPVKVNNTDTDEAKLAYDPSKVNQGQYGIFLRSSSNKVTYGVPNSVDVYAVDNIGDLKTVDLYFETNYLLTDVSFVHYNDGVVEDYLNDVDESEYVEDGSYVNLVVTVNVLDNPTATLSGKIGTIYYTLLETNVTGSDPLTFSFDEEYSSAQENYVADGTLYVEGDLELQINSGSTPAKSSDSTLKDLGVYSSSAKTVKYDFTGDNGAVVNFNPSKESYSLTVENTVDSVYVAATANSSAALSVQGGNTTYSLTAGSARTITVTVTAEDSSSRTYNIIVTRKAAEGGSGSGGGEEFNPSDVQNGEYAIYFESSGSISLDSQASIDVYVIDKVGDLKEVDIWFNASYVLSDVSFANYNNGVEEFYVSRIESEYDETDGIHLVVAVNTVDEPDATLSGKIATIYFTLESANYDGTPGTDPLNIAFDGENATFQASDYSDGNIITTGANVNLKVLEAGQSKDSDNTLSSLSVLDHQGGNTISSWTFNPSTTSYTVNVANGVTSVYIAASANSAKATITSGTGTKTGLAVGDNQFNIVVKAEDGSTKTYTVKVVRAADTNNALSNITVIGSDSNSYVNYSATTNSYTFTVPYDVTYVTVTGTATSNTSTVTGNGKYNLDVNVQKTITVYATSQSGAKGTSYVIKVTRQKEDVNTVSNIEVYGYEGGPKLSNWTFNPSTQTYELNVDNAYDTVFIKATSSAQHPSWTGTGSKSLAVGVNTIKVYATSQAGNKGTEYTLNITRAEGVAPSQPTFDPGSITQSYGLYFQANSSIYLDTPTSIDVYVVDNAHDLQNINVWFNTSYVLSNVSFVNYNNGVEQSYMSSPDESEYDETYGIHLVVSVNTVDSSDTLVGKIATINFTLTTANYTSNTPLRVEFDGENAIFEDTDYSDSPASINLVGAVVSMSVTSGTDTTVAELASASVDSKNLSVNGNIIEAYTTSNYNSTSANLQLTTKNEGTITSIKYGSVILVPGTQTYNGSITLGNPGETTNVSIVVTSKDGSATKTYTFALTRKQSSDTSVTIVVKGSADNKTYSVISSTSSVYNYEVPTSAGNAIITVSANGYAASVTGSGTVSIPTAGHEIVVTAQDGTKKTIYVNISKGKDTNNAISNIVVQKSSSDTTVIEDIHFASGTTNYSITVPYNTTSIYLNVTKVSSTATITGAGTQTLSVGNNVFKVFATSESGDAGTNYSITVTRTAASSDSKLTGLAVNGNPISKFSGNTTSYNLIVGRDVSSVTLTPTLSDVKATTDLKPSYSLKAAGNTTVITLVVKAESGATTTYTLNITRGEDLNTITNITFDNIDSSIFTFNASAHSYTFEVPGTVETITPTVTVDGQYATVSGATTYSLVSGLAKTFTIYATSEAGNKGSTYTFSITRKGFSRNNYLTDISIDGTTLAGFAYDINKYYYSVGHDVTSVSISVVKSDPAATVTFQSNPSLKVGVNTIDITVTSEDQTKNIYTISITRGNTDNKINNITFNELDSSDFTFNAEITTYDINVGYSISTLTPVVSLNDAYAKANYQSSYALVAGQVTTFTISASSETGVKGKTYTFNIRREQEIIIDLTISNITVVGNDSKGYLTFDPAVTKYDIEVPYAVTSVSINVTPVSSTGVEKVGYGSFNLNQGETLSKTVYLQSTQDSSRGTSYVINVTRATGSSNNTLSDLTINNITVDNFSPTTTSYEVKLDYSTEFITVGATASDSKATVSGTGTKTLTLGSNNISITVTSEVGTIKTYTLNILRAEDKYEITNITISNVDYTFDKDTLDASFTLEYSLRNISIDVEVGDASYAKVFGEGAKSLEVGTTVIKVFAVSQMGTQSTIYTFTFNVLAADTNTDLSSLSVKIKGAEQITNFDPNKTTYSIVNVDSDVTYVIVDAVAASKNAFVTGLGTVALNSGTITGSNVVILTVKVLAEDGISSKEYKITVSRESVNLADDNSITEISVIGSDGIEYFGADKFNANIYEYDLTSNLLPYNLTSVYVSVKAATGATVTGNGTYKLTSNLITLTIYATSESGIKGSVYTISLAKKEAGTNTNLASIKLDGSIISNFATDVTSYSVKYPNAKTRVDIEAVAEDPSTLVKILVDGSITTNRTFQLVSGETVVITINTIAEDGSMNSYTLSITRSGVVGELENLYVEGYVFANSEGETINFDSKTFDYYLEVEYEVESVNIVAENSDITLEIRGDGIKNLVVGQRRYQVSVIPTEGDISSYYIYITRKLHKTNTINVTSVTIDEVPNFIFQEDKVTYSDIVVESNVSSLNVNVLFESSEDEVSPSYELINNDSLNFGNNNVLLVMTSSDGTKKNLYSINVYRKPIEITSISSNVLTDLSKDYTTSNDYYIYNVNNDVQSVDFQLALSSSARGVNYKIENRSLNSVATNNEVSLKAGNNTITITVSSSDKVAKTLRLLVIRDGAATTSENTNNYLIPLIVVSVIGGVLVIGAAVAIIVIIKKNKQDEYQF